jgi:hypothetical protein
MKNWHGPEAIVGHEMSRHAGSDLKASTYINPVLFIQNLPEVQGNTESCMVLTLRIPLDTDLCAVTVFAQSAPRRPRFFPALGLKINSDSADLIMAMNTPAAYGLYPHEVAPHEIIRNLNHAGFENGDICMMLSPAHPIATVVRDASILNPERRARASTAALIGWLSEFGAVVVPDAGVFINSQAFRHAFMGAKNALCGNSTTLVALGFPEDRAKRFEDALRQAGVLVYVSCPESEKANWAVELLQCMGAREAATLASQE